MTAAHGEPHGRQERLVVYGTLAPGESNEHVMASLAGTWTPATVRGTRVDSGTGAATGYPGITLDDAGEVACLLFESADLPNHWDRLDEFEGPGYVRVPVTVTVADGSERRIVTAFIYELSGL